MHKQIVLFLASFVFFSSFQPMIASDRNKIQAKEGIRWVSKVAEYENGYIWDIKRPRAYSCTNCDTPIDGIQSAITAICCVPTFCACYFNIECVRVRPDNIRYYKNPGNNLNITHQENMERLTPKATEVRPDDIHYYENPGNNLNTTDQENMEKITAKVVMAVIAQKNKNQITNTTSGSIINFNLE